MLIYVRDFLYYGDFVFCGDLWIVGNGYEILMVCGVVVNLIDDLLIDMMFKL